MVLQNSFRHEIDKITVKNITFPNATDAWISYFCIHFKGSFRILSEREKKDLALRIFVSRYVFNYSV